MGAKIQLAYLGNLAPVVCEIGQARKATLPAEVSRYPSVVRDLALLVAHDQPLQALLDALRAAAPAIVNDIELFDVYQGKGIEKNQKSLAFHIVMQDTEKTLADNEADMAIQQLIDIAVKQFAAALRT